MISASGCRLSIGGLNALFNSMSNAVLNNVAFSCGTLARMAEMHPSMSRLYRVARAMQRADSQADLARLLNTSSQRVKNWEGRGLSQRGATEAEGALGVSPLWLLEGVGPEPAAHLSTDLPTAAAQLVRLDPRSMAIAAGALTRFLARRDATLDITQEADAELLCAVIEVYEKSRDEIDADVSFGASLADILEAREVRNGKRSGSAVIPAGKQAVG